MKATRRELELPDHYIFYPALTWPHKNHVRLVEAIANLRDHFGLKVNAVFTGVTSQFTDQRQEGLRNLRECISRLGLEEQVQILGYLPERQLREVCRMSLALVVPTLFEAASGPVFEGWQEGLPVACSTVTSLPEQVGDAALLFDPESVPGIADAVRRLYEDEALRTELSARGRKRLAQFSWERTARAYRAVYRRAAQLPLAHEDRALLAWDWMREPGATSGE
jgi:glycosyltransferase involved in cell wall biosynthesis